MQARMKHHQLTQEQILVLLETEKEGHLATLNSDGSPYVVPVHFVYFDNRIYVHGLPKGQKVGNLTRDSRVCFCVERTEGLLMDERPCDVNTAFQSVVVRGQAKMLTDVSVKNAVLRHIIEKYTPSLAAASLPEAAVRGTGVVEITIEECTGKYFK